MRMMSVLLTVSCLAACVTETEEAEERLPTPEEVQAAREANSAKFLEDNTYDGVFHLPRPPSVDNEMSYSSCSHQWTQTWYFWGLPAGTQWHSSTCDNGVGQYCSWVDVWLECAVDPVNCGDHDPVCTTTSCACVGDDDGGSGGGGGECGCSGYCGGSCCI